MFINHGVGLWGLKPPPSSLFDFIPSSFVMGKTNGKGTLTCLQKTVIQGGHFYSLDQD